MILLVLACTAPAEDSGGVADSAGLLDQLRDGRLTLAQAAEGGLPLETEEGWLFLAKGQGVDLAGDFSEWERLPMTEEDKFSWLVVPIDAPEGQLYKLVRGERWSADPWSRSYGFDEFGEHSLVQGAGAHLERWFFLDDRVVRVWVPAEAPTHHLYAHDGQNLFNPGAMWGGWHVQDSVGPGTLVVGIDNTAARMDEYTQCEDDIEGATFGGGASAYAAMVEDEIIPVIEAHYGAPERRGVMGSSLGGLVSLSMAARGGWDYAASLSGTVGWGSIGQDNPTIMADYLALGPFGVPLYLDSGGGPGSGCVDADGDGVEDDSPDAEDNYCENRQMVDALSAAGWTWNQDLWHWWEEGATHDEAAWAARVWRPVAIFEEM